jgi:phosphorylcholine metabolism protein LicD
MNSEDAFKDLLCVKGILDKLGIRFFLFQGTCLGAYRNKDFIEYDGDVDLGVFGEEHKDTIERMMDKEGFMPSLAAPRAITAKRNVIFNIMFFVKEEDEFVSYAVDECLTPLWCFPSKFGELKEIEFKGEKFLALSPIEEYLEWTYGEDWQEPIKGKSAQDYWNIHPEKVAKIIIKKHGHIETPNHPKVKEEMNKLL